jgi:hypothetical protein
VRTPGQAVREGFARVGEVRVQVLVAWFCSVAVAMPLAAALYVALRDDLGASIAAENLVGGWDDHWHRAFSARAQGIETTFDAGIVGMGAVLRALDAQITGALWSLPGPILGAALVYALLWIVFAGGFLERFVRGGEGSVVFFTGAVRHTPRLLVLAAVAAAGYWVWLSPVRGALDGVVERATIDTIDERVHFGWVVGKYAVIWLGVWTVALLHDYAKVLAVADPDASLPRCLGGAWTTLRTRTAAVYATSAMVAGLGAVGLGAYWVIAPGAGQDNGLLLLVAFGLSQLSVLLRITIRAAGWGSATALLDLGPARAAP